MIAKGQSAPLLYTKKARERILVAIRWDVRSKKTTLLDNIRGTNQQHDLDVTCFVFDDNGTYIDFVGSMAQEAMDQTGCIYHSGDDATGEGDGDDESISCELAGLPATTRDLVFVTEIRSDHVFKEIDDPYVRIADGMTDENLFEMHMTGSDAADKKACVMARLTRDSTSPTGWNLHHIGDYPDLNDISDWAEHIKRYI